MYPVSLFTLVHDSHAQTVPPLPYPANLGKVVDHDGCLWYCAALDDTPAQIAADYVCVLIRMDGCMQCGEIVSFVIMNFTPCTCLSAC